MSTALFFAEIYGGGFLKTNILLFYAHTNCEVIKMPKKKKKTVVDGAPIPIVYPDFGTDLAQDNLENDIPDADLQDL